MEKWRDVRCVWRLEAAGASMIMLSIRAGIMSITGYHHLLDRAWPWNQWKWRTMMSWNQKTSGNRDKTRRLSWHFPFVFEFFEPIWCLLGSSRVDVLLCDVWCLEMWGGCDMWPMWAMPRVISERVSEVTCLIRPVWTCPPVRPWRMTRAPITDNIVISELQVWTRPRPRHPAFLIPEGASRLCSQHLKSLAFSSYLF